MSWTAASWSAVTEIEPYWWYRDLRKYGTVPRTPELVWASSLRLILYATGMAGGNIRDVIPFPRTPGSG